MPDQAQSTPEPNPVEGAIKWLTATDESGRADGQFVRTLYVRRTVKAYGLHESELNHLGFVTWLATTFFSLGGSFISLAAGIWLAAGLEPDPLSAEGLVAVKIGAPVAIVLGLIFLGLGGWAAWSRKSDIDRIKDESEVVT